MARHNKTGRSKGEPRHVRIYHWMMDTAAWQSLNATQRAIYLEMVATLCRTRIKQRQAAVFNSRGGGIPGSWQVNGGLRAGCFRTARVRCPDNEGRVLSQSQARDGVAVDGVSVRRDARAAEQRVREVVA